MAVYSHPRAGGARGFRTCIWRGYMARSGRYRSAARSADPIGAPSGAGKNMIDPFDDKPFAQHFAEDCELRATESLAGRRRRANRAVVLDEQKRAVRLFRTARHIALAAADIGKGRELAGQGAPLGKFLAVQSEAVAFPAPDEPFQALLAEYRPGGLQQLQRQVGVPVGKAPMPAIRQLPILLRPPAPLAAKFGLDQAVRLEVAKMLACAGRSHAEARAHVESRLRPPRLEVEQDSIVAGSRHPGLTVLLVTVYLFKVIAL